MEVNRFTRVPNPCNLSRWEHGSRDLPLITHGSQGLSPKYDMDVYMATLFGGEAWEFVLRIVSSKKLVKDPTRNTSPHNVFA